MTRPLRIHGLPGMGCDGRMFPHPWDSLSGWQAHSWPTWQGESTLEALAERVCIENEISDGDVVVGASLGGMVGCEIARLRQLSALVLLGSACHPSEIGHPFDWIHPIARIAPFWLIQGVARRLPMKSARMFADAEPEFVRAMCKAIFRWKGIDPSIPPPIRIHGRRDWVIPPPTGCQRLISGGHVISMTHPRMCVESIQTALAQLGGV